MEVPSGDIERPAQRQADLSLPTVFQKLILIPTQQLEVGLSSRSSPLRNEKEVRHSS